MIQYHEPTKTFTLTTRSSFYALAVNADNRLVHLAYGQLPPHTDTPHPLRADVPFDRLQFSSNDNLSCRDEIMTFGDVADHEVTLKATFHPSTGTPVRDLRLRYDSHAILDNAQPGLSPNHKTQNTTKRQTLAITLKDPAYPCQAVLYLRVTPEHDTIERWLELTNTGDQPITFEQCFFGTLHLPPDHYELTHIVGGHAREFTTERIPLATGSTTLESKTISTSLTHNPFVMICPANRTSHHHGLVYFAQLAYSGNWRITVEHTPNRLTFVHAGYNHFDFELILEPGQSHTTPAMIHSCSNQGFNGASQRSHAFINDYVLPCAGKKLQPRPVLYNSWEATWFDVDLDQQIQIARKAASIGVELYCLDDGWFGDRNSDRQGLGDWFVKPGRFPKGLHPLIDEVHKLGMQFGLWFEPEMVNPDSDLYRQHPDWVLNFPNRPRTLARNQLILDFGKPEVVELIFNAIDKMLAEYKIDFIKWDMNRAATEPGSPAGKNIWRTHAQNVYSLYDRLREKYPHLAIESCSSGGGRVDPGILARADQVWPSDNTDALCRTIIQEGFSLAYPARAMSCWVTERTNPETKRTIELPTRFDIAMRGILGIGSNLTKITNDELTQYTDYISFYKRIRHIVQLGVATRLQCIEDLGASIVQYTTADAAQAVLSIARVHHHKAQLLPRAVLKNLHPKSTYAVTDHKDNTLAKMTGFELMTIGLPTYFDDAPCVIGYTKTLLLNA